MSKCKSIGPKIQCPYEHQDLNLDLHDSRSRRRRLQRWLTASLDMSSSKLPGVGDGQEAWRAAVRGVAESDTTEQLDRAELCDSKNQSFHHFPLQNFLTYMAALLHWKKIILQSSALISP